MWLFLIHMSLS